MASFPSFSGVGYVNGGRVSVVVCGREDHSDSIICRRFGIDDFSLFPSSASVLESSACFFELFVAFSSMATPNP